MGVPSLIDMCSTCSICTELMPQSNPRFSHFGKCDEPILIIDDMDRHVESMSTWISTVAELIGTADFTYTQTVRCWNEGDVPLEGPNQACAIYTRLLLEQPRALIATTQRGCQQLSINHPFEAGKAFRSKKYGVILFIEPLWEVTRSLKQIKFYKSRFKKLREAVGA